jgi:CRP/FNR family transcriptional regulator, cyclic AMP receptor protein
LVRARFGKQTACDRKEFSAARHSVDNVMNSAAVVLAWASVVASLCWWTTIGAGWVTAEKVHRDYVGRDYGPALSKSTSGPQSSSSEEQRGAVENHDVRQALIASGLFAKTDPDVASALSKQLQPTSFPPNNVISDRRTYGDGLYVIISGKVKVSHRRPDGCETVLGFLGAREIFGATTLFDRGTRELSIVTLTDVVVVHIVRDQLLRWMAERHEVRDQVLRLFARWVKRSTDSVVNVASADARSRIADRLLLYAKRFGWQEAEMVRLVVRDLSLDDFSRLVGVAPHTVVATFRDFEERGWIRIDRDSVLIVDGQALRSVRSSV